VKLVTYDDGKVGRIDGEEVVRLDVPSMRAWFERGGADDTSERVALSGSSCVRRSRRRSCSTRPATSGARRGVEERRVVHQIAPWINFFQNVGDHRPRRAIIYRST
jgi:hypothetical protein